VHDCSELQVTLSRRSSLMQLAAREDSIRSTQKRRTFLSRC